MNSTVVDFKPVTPEVDVESHNHRAVRYFNGRQYTTNTLFSFFAYRDGSHNFATISRYTFLPGEESWTIKRVGFSHRMILNTQPTNLQRTMMVMVPDDMQAVPF